MIGAMRHRIRIERKTGTPDGGGGLTGVTWEKVRTCAAQIKPVTSGTRGEQWHGDKLEDRVTHRIVMRAGGPAFNGADRIVHGSRVFNIKRVTNADERGRFLQVLAEEGSAT